MNEITFTITFPGVDHPLWFWVMLMQALTVLYACRYQIARLDSRSLRKRFSDPIMMIIQLLLCAVPPVAWWQMWREEKARSIRRRASK